MIPIAHIEEWRDQTPWQESYQVEQDLLISRMLIAMYNDDFLSQKLAFRGGTALHKLYFDPALRYSEDIDMVQLDTEPIGPVMKRIDETIDFFDQKRATVIRGHGAKAVYKYTSEESSIPLKIKIEINCQEHHPYFPLVDYDHVMDNPYFNGKASLKTYQLNELLGSKLRALYQRNKGRDLFDLYKARELSEYDRTKMINAFHHYMELSGVKAPTAKQLANNLALKIQDIAFRNDMKGLIRTGNDYDIDQAYEWFITEIIPFIDELKPTI